MINQWLYELNLNCLTRIVCPQWQCIELQFVIHLMAQLCNLCLHWNLIPICHRRLGQSPLCHISKKSACWITKAKHLLTPELMVVPWAASFWVCWRQGKWAETALLSQHQWWLWNILVIWERWEGLSSQRFSCEFSFSHMWSLVYVPNM